MQNWASVERSIHEFEQDNVKAREQVAILQQQLHAKLDASTFNNHRHSIMASKRLADLEKVTQHLTSVGLFLSGMILALTLRRG